MLFKFQTHDFSALYWAIFLNKSVPRFLILRNLFEFARDSSKQGLCVFRYGKTWWTKVKLKSL